jgi:radical SAM superfamily enzyme YgiQ (UPF0313 family)
MLTRKLILSLPWTFVSVSVIVPYPGTPVARKMQELGLIGPDAQWEDYVMIGALPKWRTVQLTADDLVRFQRQLTRAFYLNPKYIVRQLSAIRSLRDVQYWASAGTAYAKWYLSGRL